MHEALAEREVLLRKAPHIIWPMRFVLPHVDGLRPRWMIRAGLFLYDHLARRRRIPGSKAIDLKDDPAGRPLKPNLGSGFAYWDCWVDDARLVVLNARAAAQHGAQVLTRCKVTAAAAQGGTWRLTLHSADRQRTVEARALVNAAGPWSNQVQESIEPGSSPPPPLVRLVKGSHVVVPRIAGADDAYLLQSSDGRVVFALPYEERFTIIGTTDIAFDGNPANVCIDEAETNYLLELAARFFKAPLHRRDIVWTYSGVRALHDDDSSDLSAVTRDYRLELATGEGKPPLLSVIGGKVTTYRRLAEEALSLLAPQLGKMGPAWTAGTPLPGGEMRHGDFDAWFEELKRAYPAFDPAYLRRLARRYGTESASIIGTAREFAEMGRDLGAGLTESEVLYLKTNEWARSAEDVLWRRTKVGLHLSPAERESAARQIEQLL